MPIFGIRYEGVGELRVSVTGEDDATVTNKRIEQDFECCFRQSPQKARYNQTVSLDGKPLRLRFYGWILDGTAKRNRQGEALIASRCSYVHQHLPFQTEPVPFDPKFIAEDPESNSLRVLPGETAFFVPNPYDILASTPTDLAKFHEDDRRSRWYVSNLLHTHQSDWFFQLFLHEITAKPLTFKSEEPS